MPTEKRKRRISRGIDQIPAEWIKAGVITIRYEINKLLILFGKKKELFLEWKESNIEGR